MPDRRPQHDLTSATPSSPLGHRIMFVLLTCLAFVLFVPTVLLPVVREYGELRAEEDRIRRSIDELERRIAERDDLLDAFRHDAAVNERLAVLDLRYRRPNEVILPVVPNHVLAAASAAEPATEPGGALRLPDDWPAWALAAEQWAGERGLMGLFLDSTLRVVFLLMSGGILVAAFVLFAPTVRTATQVDRSTARRAPGVVDPAA